MKKATSGLKRSSLIFLMLGFGFLSPFQASAQTSASADQYYQYGNRFYSEKDYARAAQYYGAAVRLNPNHAAAWQGLGNATYAAGQPQKALAYYEKALQLNPSNTQLSSFVQRLRAQYGGGAPAGAQPALQAAGDALSRGKALFQQKQYAAAVPYLQQAVQENPKDATAYYYLGYAQYAAGDKKNAALNFGRSAQLSQNTQTKAYADRLKAQLPPADQKWVEGQLAKTPGQAERERKFGFRALPGIALFKIKDLEADADSIEKRAADNAMGLDGSVPQGNLYFGLEPFVRPIPNLDLALGFAFFPIGKYSYTLSQPSNFNFKESAVFDMSSTVIPFTARGVFGKGKTRFFVGAGAGLYSVNVDLLDNITSDLASTGINGKFDGSTTGFHVTTGAEFRLASSVGVSPYLFYRSAKVTDLTGTQTTTSGGAAVTESGTLMFDTKDNKIDFLKDGDTADPEDRPLELDLSGIQFGIMVSVFF